MKRALKCTAVLLAVSLVMTLFSGCRLFMSEQEKLADTYIKAGKKYDKLERLNHTQILTFKNTDKNVTVSREITSDISVIRDDEGKYSEFFAKNTTDYGTETTSDAIYYADGKMYYDTDEIKYVSSVEKDAFNSFYQRYMVGGSEDYKFDLMSFTSVTGTTDENDILTISYTNPTDECASGIYDEYEELIESELMAECRISEFKGEVKINKDGYLLSSKENIVVKKNSDRKLELEIVVKVTSWGDEVKVDRPEKQDEFKEIESVPAFYAYASSSLSSLENGKIEFVQKFETTSPAKQQIITETKLKYATDSDGVLKYDYNYTITDRDEFATNSEEGNIDYDGKRTVATGEKRVVKDQSQEEAAAFIFANASIIPKDLGKIESVTMTEQGDTDVLTIKLSDDVYIAQITAYLDTLYQFRLAKNLKVQNAEYTMTVKDSVPIKQGYSMDFTLDVSGRTYKGTFTGELVMNFGGVSVENAA